MTAIAENENKQNQVKMESSAPSVQTEAKAPRTWDELSSAERNYLKALSKEVYGSSSKAKKLIEEGFSELLTEETTEYVPGKTEEEEGTTRQVRVPLKRIDGAFQSVTKHHTTESVKTTMLFIKAKRDEIRALIKKQQEEADAKRKQAELTNQVQQQLAGSANGF